MRVRLVDIIRVLRQRRRRRHSLDASAANRPLPYICSTNEYVPYRIAIIAVIVWEPFIIMSCEWSEDTFLKLLNVLCVACASSSACVCVCLCRKTRSRATVCKIFHHRIQFPIGRLCVRSSRADVQLCNISPVLSATKYHFTPFCALRTRRHFRLSSRRYFNM